MPARKPTALHLLSGAFDRNPSRRRAREAEPQPEGPLGAPPAHLSATVAACWSEIAGLTSAGVLARSDRLIVEHAAYLLADLREKQWRAPPALLLRYECTLARLGMSPVDRSRIIAAKNHASDGPDPFDF
jgi:hypothetical protein